MPQTTATQPETPTRHDGWTSARRVCFLDRLAATGNVRAACAAVGMSREAAYRLRRRNALFSRGWAAALVTAREAAAETLAGHALDGFEEDVWYRGELVGRRRKYDVRLMLAHMARLDVLAQDEHVREDAVRFDELLAANAGIEPLSGNTGDATDLPPGREAFALEAREKAARELEDSLSACLENPSEAGAHEPGGDYAAVEAASLENWRQSEGRALACWDRWFADACLRIDALVEGQGRPDPASDTDAGTPSIVSTLPLREADSADRTCVGGKPQDGAPSLIDLRGHST